jgi:chromosome partitioning protein
MMVTITLLNRKGGVGKTSTCFHLSATLAGLGLRVLLVDNDPQASLTQGFFGPEGLASRAGAPSVADLYAPGLRPPPERVIRATGLPGVDLVPGAEALTAWNVPSDRAWPGAERGLAGFLAAAAPGYDLALIDCPPNLVLCARAALVAADHLIVPIQPEDFGSQGLGPVTAMADRVRATANPRLGAATYLLTLVDRRLTIHAGYAQLLRELYGAAVYTAVVPLATDLKEAVTARRPIAAYKPRSAAARALRVLADELIVRTALGAPAAAGREVA